MTEVTVERSEAVLILSLESETERNRLSAPVAEKIRSVLSALGETATRVVVLRGQGETFCAGGDLGAHADRVKGELSAETWLAREERIGEAITAVRDCPVPTIAAVEGPAFNEGGCLALACDIRLASPTASIGFGFRRFGQAAAAGASWLLPRLVGRDVAAELLYTGRLLDASEAARRGLFTRVVSGDSFADELASLTATVSTGPPAAMQATKHLLDTDHASLSAAIERETEIQERLARTWEFREGVAAFLERRPPEF